uniref:Uncharacterized protein n=1 Tax=viral metagenome TaxID=1070528 RepID=A0A6C0BM62_9ZZZZ
MFSSFRKSLHLQDYEIISVITQSTHYLLG